MIIYSIVYAGILKEALASYKNASSINYNSESLIDFADFMIKEINTCYNLLIS